MNDVSPLPVPDPEFAQAPEITPVPDDATRRERLAAVNVPEEYWDWLGPYGVAPLGQKLGIYYHHMDPEKILASMPVGGNEQNAGILHGGAHMVLAEGLGSIASILHVRINLELTRNVVGTELGATHHRPAVKGRVWGTCTPINLGRQLTVHEIVMRDDDGRRLSTARMTNMILAPRD